CARGPYPRGMSIVRAAVVAFAALSLAGCGALEPSATDLVRGASAKMQTAKSLHIEGTGTFGIKGGMSMSFDFKLVGDVELPDPLADDRPDGSGRAEPQHRDTHARREGLREGSDHRKMVGNVVQYVLIHDAAVPHDRPRQ